MDIFQLGMPEQRTHLWATLFGMAVLALAIFGLAQPATAHAVWDIEVYDKCIQGGDFDYICCDVSGGDWDDDAGKCVAPSAATPPQSPGEVIQAPGTGTAAQSSPVDAGRAPQPAPATPTPTAPPRLNPGWGIGGVR